MPGPELSSALLAFYELRLGRRSLIVTVSGPPDASGSINRGSAARDEGEEGAGQEARVEVVVS